jgi:hypothetical protein
VTTRTRVAHSHFRACSKQPGASGTISSSQPFSLLFILASFRILCLHLFHPYDLVLLTHSVRSLSGPAMPNSRSFPPPGNRRQSAGPAPPTTPRKNGADLSAQIHSFEQQWQLGLRVRDENWSPLKITKDLPDKIYEHLKRLYWKGDFHEAIGRFALQAKPLSAADTQAARDQQLTLLHRIVGEIDEAKGRGPGSRAGTPVSGGRGLIPGLRALKTDQSCKLHSLFLQFWAFPNATMIRSFELLC